MSLNDLPPDVFACIISFVRRDWFVEDAIEEEGSSYNKEITNLVSYMKHLRLYRRLKKYIEIWWKKTKKNIVLREHPSWWTRDQQTWRIIRRGGLEFWADIEVVEMWEQREWDLDRWNIMCAIYHFDEFPNNNIWGHRYSGGFIFY
tara:strand:+ start:1576 stop:2013 length:438 start_codon:yes stop_codon:yes gene_type:complete